MESSKYHGEYLKCHGEKLKRVLILSRVDRKGLTDEITFQARSEGGEGERMRCLGDVHF